MLFNFLKYDLKTVFCTVRRVTNRYHNYVITSELKFLIELKEESLNFIGWANQAFYVYYMQI